MTGAPRHSGHPIATVKYRPLRDDTPRTGSCGCGWSMTWQPDRSGGDPDQPFIDGYGAHLRAVGVRQPRVMGEPWQRLSLVEGAA